MGRFPLPPGDVWPLPNRRTVLASRSPKILCIFSHFQTAGLGDYFLFYKKDLTCILARRLNSGLYNLPDMVKINHATPLLAGMAHKLAPRRNR